MSNFHSRCLVRVRLIGMLPPGHKQSCFSVVMLFLLIQWRDTLANEESLAIACGWTYDAFRDPHTSLQWLPDYRFIGDVGRTATIQQSSDSSFSSTVRYFTDEGTHCYKLNTTAGGRYIIRGSFSYGNFDGKCSPPVFGVSINSRLQYRVDSSSDPVLEVVLDPATSILEYCLIPIPNGSTPFISTLELLLAPNCTVEDRFTRYPTRSLREVQSQAHPTTVIGLVGGVLLSLMILTMATSMCIYKIFCRGESSAVKPQSPPKYTTNKELVVEVRPIEITQYTLKELEEAIGTRIAEGGFGSVYRGNLPSKQEVAIKVRSATSAQGLREFTAELTFLSQIRHENLVPLLGYCTEGQQQILVYPYMSNGSLQDRLYGDASKRKPLDWQTRLSIAVGAARGLNFLHTRGPRPIIHRDVKSSNILLNDSMIAKVADFGFSKFAPQEDDSLVSLEIRGTTGYLDPEYYMTQMLTTKSDVFSFGVVLLEIICGREPLSLLRPRSEASLVEWVRPLLQEPNIQALHAIVDPAISTNFTPEAMWRVVEVALCSVEPSGGHRPDMATVVRELDDALIIENNASQYLLSMDSLGSFRRSSSSIKVPTSLPATVPLDPPAFAETLDSTHPRQLIRYL